MQKVKIAVIAVVAILVLIVVFQNWGDVTTRVLVVDITMPKTLLLILTLAIGFVLGFAVAGWVLVRKRRKQG